MAFLLNIALRSTRVSVSKQEIAKAGENLEHGTSFLGLRLQKRNMILDSAITVTSSRARRTKHAVDQLSFTYNFSLNSSMVDIRQGIMHRATGKQLRTNFWSLVWTQQVRRIGGNRIVVSKSHDLLMQMITKATKRAQASPRKSARVVCKTTKATGEDWKHWLHRIFNAIKARR